METSLSSVPSSFSCFAVPVSPLPRRHSFCWQRRGAGADGGRRPSPVVLRSAGSKGRDFGGELVDEDMVILRKRIYELRMAEEGEEGPPAHWMEWEKRHHGSYTAAVCGAVGMLQSLLMRTRPSVALGVAALVAFSVPASAAMVVLRAAAVMQVVLHGGHVRW